MRHQKVSQSFYSSEASKTCSTNKAKDSFLDWLRGTWRRRACRSSPAVLALDSLARHVTHALPLSCIISLMPPSNPLFPAQCTAAVAWQTSPSPGLAWLCPSSAPSSTSMWPTSAPWRTSSPTWHVSGGSKRVNKNWRGLVGVVSAYLLCANTCIWIHRHYWEDLRGEEGSVWRVCRQSECKDLQRRPEASAAPQHRWQGEISQTHRTEVGNAADNNNNNN